MSTKNDVSETGRVEQTERIFESWRDVAKAIVGATVIVYFAVFVGQELGASNGFVFVLLALLAVVAENILKIRLSVSLESTGDRFLYVTVFGFFAGSAVMLLVAALMVSSQ